MAVLGRKIGRGDIRLIRGDTQTIGVRWRQQNQHTGQTTPMDLTDWIGRLELRSLDGNELWLQVNCTTMTSDGLACAELSASALQGEVWQWRHAGQWKIIVTDWRKKNGIVRTIGWGYFTITE